MIDTLKGWIENTYTSEVINNTDYYLYVRTENDKSLVSNNDLKNFVITDGNSKLTESLGGMGIPIDGIVFPDGSIYKGWSGSKVTVTEKNGNIDVKQSVGTAIANGIANIGKFVQNIFLSEDSKKEYYGYYSKEEVSKMEAKHASNSIISWKKQIEQSENADYFNQKSSENYATGGCIK